MPRRLLTLLAIAALSIAARAQTADARTFTAKEIAQGWCDGTVLAKPRQEQLASVDAAEANEGWTVERKFERFGGLRVLTLKSGDTADSAIARLRATGRYEFVDRDYIKRAYATASGPPDDPYFPMQWGLDNTGSNPGIDGPGVAGADIHAVSAWTNTRTDAASVVVAIVDSGARLTHRDLAPNLWTNPSPNGTIGGFRYVSAVHGINATVPSGNANSGNPTDDAGHGTHVAGIVGAAGNNAVDGTGVAWSVQLMPLKFIETDTGSTSDEMICLDFALANGAQILNGSFGSSAYDPSEYAALQALDAAGVILVFAAGNKAEDNGLSPSYPASYNLNNIVAVAASDNRDDVIFFSSYGSGNVDLGSPGYEILSTYYTSDTATAILSGTSMATPFVTGSLALLKAQFPGDTPRQLINRLLRHVDADFNFNGRVQTGGRLDLAAALASAPGDNAPFNDNFASRAQLSGSSLSVRSSNAGATREAGEPSIGGNPGGASLWWQWTAPASGSVTLSTAGSGYATLVGVYTGASLSSLATVASNATPGTGASSVTFVAQAGTTYELTVDGQNGASGLTVFLLNYNNDAFELPTTLTGASTGITSTTRYATRESGEPQILPQYAGGHSVWYAWTAPKSGQFQVSAFSYDFDPLLGVYTGSSLTALTQVPGAAAVGGPIVSTDNIPASICLCTIQATAGTTYMITVDGVGDSTTGLSDGQFTLSIADSLWQGVTQDSITCAPAVGPNGTVYVGSDDSVFYAFNSDGSSLWTSFAGEPFDTTAASIAGDGTVYAASSLGGPIYSFTAGGVLKWTLSLPGSAIVNGAAALASVSAADDTLYVKAQDGNLYAINTSNGSVKWTYPVPGVSYAPPSVGSDGTVYIGADNSVLYAINPYGAEEWTYTADAAIYTAPAIDGSGNLYFGTLGGTFYSLGRSGTLRWSFKANNSISSSAALGANGFVYFGSYDHHLYALATGNGALQWSYLLGSEVRASSPAIDSNGVVYVGCYDDNVYAINPDGSLNRTFATAGWVRSSPVISGNNLYFGSYDHKLYAFNIGANASGSSWPMLLNNAQRQGRAAALPPSITTQPASQTVSAGASPTLSVAAAGAITYQWQLNGTSITGATNSSLALTNIGTTQAGSYTVVTTNPTGSTTSSPASVTVNVSSYLFNISTRGYVGSGPNQDLDAGFYIEGTGNKNILLRGDGPFLATNSAYAGLTLVSPQL
ncbi:MAG: PQQ-binding-like beta-propeller repeat protein, partial [Opitutaceae bacterium]